MCTRGGLQSSPDQPSAHEFTKYIWPPFLAPLLESGCSDGLRCGMAPVSPAQTRDAVQISSKPIT